MRTQAFLNAWLAKGIDVTFVCFPYTAATDVPEQLKTRIQQIVVQRGFSEKVTDYFKTYHYRRTSIRP